MCLLIISLLDIVWHVWCGVVCGVDVPVVLVSFISELTSQSVSLPPSLPARLHTDSEYRSV